MDGSPAVQEQHPRLVWPLQLCLNGPILPSWCTQGCLGSAWEPSGCLLFHGLCEPKGEMCNVLGSHVTSGMMAGTQPQD